jgi:hypothetical protein
VQLFAFRSPLHAIGTILESTSDVDIPNIGAMSAVDITFIYPLPLTTTDLYQTRVFDSDWDIWDTEY